MINLPLTLHWQYGRATSIFSTFCSLISFSFNRRIMPSKQNKQWNICIFNKQRQRADGTGNSVTSPIPKPLHATLAMKIPPFSPLCGIGRSDKVSLIINFFRLQQPRQLQAFLFQFSFFNILNNGVGLQNE